MVEPAAKTASYEDLLRVPERLIAEIISGRWLLIAALDNDDPVQIRPFDSTSFDLSGLWAD